MHFVRIVWMLTLQHIKAYANYRLGAVLWVLNGMVMPLTLMAVWQTTAQFRSVPYDNNQISTYYLSLVIISRLTQTWSGESLSEKINKGEIGRWLIMPLPFWIPEMGRDFGHKIVRLLTLLPFITGFLFFWSLNHLAYLTVWQLTLFCVSIIIGYLIAFLLELIIGLAAIWFEQSNGLLLFMGSVGSFLQGSIIPLAFLPTSVTVVINMTPFRYPISLPIEILLNQQPFHMYIYALELGVFWVLILIAVVRLVYSLSIRQFVGTGG